MFAVVLRTGVFIRPLQESLQCADRTGKTGRTSMAEDTTKAGKGTGVVIGKNKGQIMHTKLSACQLNIFRDRMVSLFGN